MNLFDRDRESRQFPTTPFPSAEKPDAPPPYAWGNSGKHARQSRRRNQNRAAALKFLDKLKAMGM